MPEKFSEVELRIQELKLNKPEFVEKLLEEKHCELKVFSSRGRRGCIMDALKFKRGRKRK